MKTYYHTTTKDSWDKIQNEGLIPIVGIRSEELKEEKGVFLFKSLDDLDNALFNWFGESFDYDEELYTLEVKLPKSFSIQASQADYEVISREKIPSKYISFFRND